MSRLRARLAENYDRHYRALDSPLEGLRAARRTIHSFSRTYGPLIAHLPSGSRVLDLACGPGLLMSWLGSRSQLRVEGVDSSEPIAAIARRNLPTMRVECEDGLGFLRRHRDTYAAIFSTYFFEHIDSEDSLLDIAVAVREALLDGGFFCCRVPNAANLTGLWERYADLTHARLFTESSLSQLLQAAGFSPVRPLPIRGGLAITISNYVQHLLHRALFLAAGRTNERIFTSSICLVGYREGEAPSSGQLRSPS